MYRIYLSAAVVAGLAAAPSAAAPPPVQTLKQAEEVLDEFAAIPIKSIPPAMLADANGVAIIPHVVKAGLILGGRGGHGVLFVREKNGLWSEPVLINLGGASVGLQAGVEATDVVLIFRGRKSLDRLLEGKNKLTLGADVSIAAGPLGRQASAATDASLRAEIVSYSRSRGLFAGVSLDGAAIAYDASSNAAFRRDVRPETLKYTEMLKVRLSEMCAFTPPPGPRVIVPPATLGPPVAVPFPGPVVVPVPTYSPPPPTVSPSPGLPVIPIAQTVIFGSSAVGSVAPTTYRQLPPTIINAFCEFELLDASNV